MQQHGLKSVRQGEEDGVILCSVLCGVLILHLGGGVRFG